MDVELLTPLVTLAVPRDTKAPWLDPLSNKAELFLDFAVRVDDEIIVIPKGYITDWSSLPRFLWWLWPPNLTEAREAALVHDYLYSHLHWYFSKEFADELMREIMVVQKATRLSVDAFYWGVKHGGRGGWYFREQPNANPHWSIRHERLPYTARHRFLDETSSAG